MIKDPTLRGIALMMAFCVLAPLLDTASKLATTTIPVGQITTARFVVQGALMVPVVLAMGLTWRIPLRLAWLVANTNRTSVSSDLMRLPARNR